MDIITGYTGTGHITAENDRDINIGVFGPASYVLQTGQQMKAEVSSNNEIKIRDGVIMHQGCAASIKKNTYDSLVIANGSQGMKRIDLIVARYTRNQSTQVESLELKVIQGTPAASNPAVPAYTTGDIQAGDLVADMPMYQVTLDGLNITEVKKLFNLQTSTDELAKKLSTAQNSITDLNSNLTSLKNIIGKTYYSGVKDNYSYSKENNWDNTSVKLTLPAGTYIFVAKASPCAKGQSYDVFTIGISGISTTRTQTSYLINFGNGFYPIVKSVCVETVAAGTYGVAFWSSHNRNVNSIELQAIRIK